MERKLRCVKTPRRYDSSGRRAHAGRTQAAIIEIAQRRFLDTGYGSTTIAAIAAEAGVSVETIYKAFGGKPGLVRAIVERALRGEGPVSTYRRSDQMRVAEADPYRMIANWGVFSTEVAPRASPIVLLVRAAAVTDPEMAELYEQINTARLERMTVNAQHLFDAGHLRPEVSLEQAIDVLWTYSSAELYELLVLRRRWPLERYGRFVAEAMIAALLPANPGVPPAAPRRPTPAKRRPRP